MLKVTCFLFRVSAVTCRSATSLRLTSTRNLALRSSRQKRTITRGQSQQMPTFFRKACAAHVRPQQESCRMPTRETRLVSSPKWNCNRCPRVDTLTTFFRGHFTQKKINDVFAAFIVQKLQSPLNCYFFFIQRVEITWRFSSRIHKCSKKLLTSY